VREGVLKQFSWGCELFDFAVVEYQDFVVGDDSP
jgi:hypothetical protein